MERPFHQSRAHYDLHMQSLMVYASLITKRQLIENPMKIIFIGLEKESYK